MNEKVKVVRFHRATGVALVRGADGRLRVAHVMSNRVRLKNKCIASAVFGNKGKGEIR